jgi:hypothetical protein
MLVFESGDYGGQEKAKVAMTRTAEEMAARSTSFHNWSPPYAMGEFLLFVPAGCPRPRNLEEELQRGPNPFFFEGHQGRRFSH